MSQTEMRIRIDYALRISDEMFKQCETWAGGMLRASNIKCECKDDAIRYFKNFCDLINYKNAPDSRLDVVHFYMEDEFRKNRVIAQFSGDNSIAFKSKASFHITGDETTCITIRQEIHRDMKAYRTWYWWIEKIHIATSLAICLLSSFALLVMYVAVADINVTVQDGVSPYRSILIGIVGGCAVAFLIVRIESLKSKLFPGMTFAIGHGKTRDNTLEKIRWGIVIAAVLGIVTSMIGAILA